MCACFEYMLALVTVALDIKSGMCDLIQVQYHKMICNTAASVISVSLLYVICNTAASVISVSLLITYNNETLVTEAAVLQIIWWC
jgi:hypothetical protein